MLIWMLIYTLLLMTVGLIALPHVEKFLVEHGMTADNFRGTRVPFGLGIFIWFMLIVHFLSLEIAAKWGAVLLDHELLYVYIIALSFIFILGWLDDSIGDRSVKGFRGHLRKWIKERAITTGLLKAAGTAVVAFWVCIKIGDNFAVAAMQASLLILMTNMINLLDLRPGRALKGFFVMTAALLPLGALSVGFFYLLPVVVGALLIAFRDLRERAMLGDTGANLLGFALGFCIVMAAPLWFQAILLAGLGLLHWIAERSSITLLIERNRLLNWFDRLGRKAV